MEIIEDTLALDGMHDIRLLLDDGNCMFLRFRNVPALRVIENQITRLLANAEFETIIRSDRWVNPVYWTKAEVAEKVREQYQTATGEEAFRLAHWLLDRIDEGTFTEKEIPTVSNPTLEEYNKLNTRIQEKKDTVKDPKGVEEVKDGVVIEDVIGG